MDLLQLGSGSAPKFFEKEFEELNLRDKRLNKRALNILQAMQNNLTSCIRRLFSQPKDARQAYDFF